MRTHSAFENAQAQLFPQNPEGTFCIKCLEFLELILVLSTPFLEFLELILVLSTPFLEFLELILVLSTTFLETTQRILEG
jgi:hypothetical protein